MLDRITRHHKTLCKLFILETNIGYDITVGKQIITDKEKNAI